MTAISRPRLAKLLSLMASDHDGEALAAARAAYRHVTAAGMTWEDVLQEPAPRVITVQTARPAADPRMLVVDILGSPYTPDEREAKFPRDMLARKRFTDGQTRWLKLIAVKAGVL